MRLDRAAGLLLVCSLVRAADLEIPNFDFSGPVDDWEVAWDPVGACVVSRDETQGADKPGSLHFDFHEMRTEVVVVNNHLTSLVDGAAISMQVRRTGRSGWATINSYMTTPKGSLGVDIIDLTKVPADGAWHPVEGTFHLPAGATKPNFQVGLNGKGELWIDDLRIRTP